MRAAAQWSKCLRDRLAHRIVMRRNADSSAVSFRSMRLGTLYTSLGIAPYASHSSSIALFKASPICVMYSLGSTPISGPILLRSSVVT